MDGAQDDLHLDAKILMKFFVLGVFALSVLLKDGGGYFLGHILLP